MDLCFELARVLMNRLRGVVTVVDEVHGFSTSTTATDRLRGRYREPDGQRGHRAVLIGDEDPDFAGGSYVIVQKYLHDLTGWNAPADRAAGADHRAGEAVRHRARRREAQLRAQRADHDRWTTDGDQVTDPARQHAVRRARPRRVRDLLHRLCAVAGHDRADAAQHVHRLPGGQLRPAAGLQHRGHRDACSSCPRRPCWRAWATGALDAAARTTAPDASPAPRRPTDGRIAGDRQPERSFPG